MFAAIYSSPLLLLTIVFCTMMVTEGLPIHRRERSTDMGLIAGEDFLTILMGSNSHRTRYKKAPPITTTEIQPDELQVYARESRSSHKRTFSDKPSDINIDQRINNNLEYSKQSSDSNSANTDDGMIISVRVSSSIGHSLINKQSYVSKEIQEEVELKETTTTDLPTTEDNMVISSEEHPSIVAEANKSEFSVDEREPITINSDSIVYEPLPSPLPLAYEASSIYTSNDNNKPYQEHVIYHNNPRDPNRARSVSYSTVIQSIPDQQKPWNQQKNITSEESAKPVPATNSAAESKDYYVTSKYNPSEYNDSLEKRKDWENSYESSSRRHYEPTERNWGIPEKNYGIPAKPYTAPRQTLPIVYGQPEENYEVDEAVSVETNGRAHGVQPQVPQAENKNKKDDSQKVGYVVEGRNYRKYRVEERTSDGFIVGEYGVVSHNDGSLRGVRYTADGTISPRLIYDALMKFLSL